MCDESGEEFTNEETGAINFAQVYNQYREENNIPFIGEIVKLREDCMLSKTDMGRLLGFGENQYYRYELGEVPSPSNGKLMRMLIDNREALVCAIKESAIKESNKEKAIKALEKLSKTEKRDKVLYDLLFTGKRNIYNGYAIASVNKVRHMILFFLGHMPLGYKTALNKLMFYADFLMYKENGVGISGLTYSALPYGNVPNNFKVLYVVRTALLGAVLLFCDVCDYFGRISDNWIVNRRNLGTCGGVNFTACNLNYFASLSVQNKLRIILNGPDKHVTVSRRDCIGQIFAKRIRRQFNF